MNLYRYIKILIKGIILLIKNLKLLKKKKIVFLNSSRFGHFFQNTEIALRKINKKKLNDYLFVLDEFKVDNEDLLNIWKSYENIEIVPYELGAVLAKVFRKKHEYNTYEMVPQKKKNFHSNRIFKNLLKNPSKYCLNLINTSGKYCTITIRDSNYQNLKYNDFRDKFRDSEIEDIKKIANFLKKKNIKLIKVNNSLRTYKIKNLFDYGVYKKYNLNDVGNLIKNSYMHIGSGTAIDPAAWFIDHPILNPNIMLGNNYTLRCSTIPSMFIPLNLFDKKNKKILPLSKHIKLLQRIKKKYKVDHLTNYLQKKFNLFYKTNDYREIISAFEEYSKIIDNNFKFSKRLLEYQAKFWNIYPNTFVNKIAGQKIIMNSKKFRGSGFLPKSYFKYHKNFLN